MNFSLSNLFSLHKVSEPASEKSQEKTFAYQSKNWKTSGAGSLRRLGANSSPFGGNAYFTGFAGQASALLESTPFAPVTKRPTGLMLGDLLSQIPQETLSKVSSPNQPLHFTQSILEEALNHPENAIPLFEVFRACPRVFKTSISPHDSRYVCLPAHMLGYVSRSLQELDLSKEEPQKGHSPFKIAQDVFSLVSQSFTKRENLGHYYQMVLPRRKVGKRAVKTAPALSQTSENVPQVALAEITPVVDPTPVPLAEVPRLPARPKRRLCTVSHMDSYRKTKLAAIMESHAMAGC